MKNDFKNFLISYLNSEFSLSDIGCYDKDGVVVELRDDYIGVWFDWKVGYLGSDVNIHININGIRDYITALFIIKGILSTDMKTRNDIGWGIFTYECCD